MGWSTRSRTGPAPPTSKSVSTAFRASTRSCSRPCARRAREGRPHRGHRADSGRRRRIAVASRATHAWDRGVRHQRLHGRCRWARRRRARRDGSGSGSSRGAVCRRERSRHFHGRRGELRRAGWDVRLPRRPERAARRTRRRGRYDGARDRRCARRAVKVSPWEFAFAGVPAWEAKRYDEVKALLLEGLALHPGNTSLLYDLACVEALLGEKDDALEHLREAAKNPRVREHAKEDSDFDSLRDDPRFSEALGSPPE